MRLKEKKEDILVCHIYENGTGGLRVAGNHES